MKRPRPALVVLLVSVAVIIISLGLILVTQFQARQSAEISSVGTRDLASLATQESATPTPLPSLAPGSSTPVPSSSPSTPELPSANPTPSPAPLSAPVRVRIPRIDVNAKVLPVGLDKNKALGIPADITKVGWYELGVPPGAAQGSAVLVAHRDGRVQGHGVFYDLGQLSVGDKIAVTSANGSVLRYRVVSRELISKKRLPLEELFAIDGPARLTLISCGGYYDRDNGGYQDNVVVTAIPLA